MLFVVGADRFHHRVLTLHVLGVSARWPRRLVERSLSLAGSTAESESNGTESNIELVCE